jgi:hypothetical protein
VPPKKRVDLPDHVRKAVLDDIELTHGAALDAEERDKIRIYLATEQGLDTYEIAERLGNVSQPTVARWALKGKEAFERREREKGARESAGGDPAGRDLGGSGEREPDG